MEDAKSYEILIKITAEDISFETELTVEEVIFWLKMLEHRIMSGFDVAAE